MRTSWKVAEDQAHTLSEQTVAAQDSAKALALQAETTKNQLLTAIKPRLSLTMPPRHERDPTEDGEVYVIAEAKNIGNGAALIVGAAFHFEDRDPLQFVGEPDWVPAGGTTRLQCHAYLDGPPQSSVQSLHGTLRVTYTDLLDGQREALVFTTYRFGPHIEAW